VRATFGNVAVNVIGRADFLANKRAVGRLRDLADAERLDPGRRRVSRRSGRRPR
jgi:hypothetical protein